VDESSTTRWFLRLGALSLLVGLGAGVFELMATQAPYTPLHFGVLAAPFSQLRGAAFWLGLFAFVCAGSVLSLSAMAWAAAEGMMAIQVFDPRPGAGWLAIVRLLGQGLVLIAALDVARRLLRRGAQAVPPTPR